LRILLIQLRRIGDLILTTPAINALRHHFPDAHIALAAAREGEPLLPAIGGINQTFVLRRGVRDLAAARGVRAAAFDCVVDFTRNDRSAWLTLASGAPQRIVSDRLKRKSKLRARFYNEFVPCAMKEMHTVDYNLALLQPLGISGANTTPVLRLLAGARANGRAVAPAEPFAIFHPGSARAEKFWAAERWAEVIAFAKKELRLQPVLTSGNSSIEREHIAKIKSQLSVPVRDLSARLDLLTLAALIQRAQFVVTVDSAPMHLASALNTPQVVLFGPTNPFHWRPRHSPAAILFGSAREPLREFLPRAPKLPMNQISTGAVIDAMRSVYTAPAASAV